MQELRNARSGVVQKRFLTIFQVSKDVKLSNNFLQRGHSVQDYAVSGIAKLENPPSDPIERLREFEGYWMVKLNTLEPHGVNNINEYERIVKKVASG